jgi:HEAT repeat protein
VLLKALKDSATNVRSAAVSALAAVAAREQETAPALVPLLKDREPQVRMAAADAFRQMPFAGGKIEPATLTAILNALREEANTGVRGRLIGSLCHSPDLRVVRELVHYLQSNIPGLREQALESLGRIAPFLPEEVKKGKDAQGRPVQEAVAALIDCLKVKEHRGPAAHVLMYLGPDAASAVPALIDAINHADNQLDSAILHSRVQLIQALGGIGPGASGATKTLASRLRTDPDYFVRQYAAETLGRIGPQAAEAVPELRLALKDKAVQVRDHAAPALGLIGSKAAQAIPDLLQTMRTDKSNQTRWLAAHSLTQIGMQGQKSAVPLLIEGLADEDVNVVFHCAVALGQIGPDAKAALAALERVQKNPRVPLQTKIAEAIGKIRGTSKQ